MCLMRDYLFMVLEFLLGILFGFIATIAYYNYKVINKEEFKSILEEDAWLNDCCKSQMRVLHMYTIIYEEMDSTYQSTFNLKLDSLLEITEF